METEVLIGYLSIILVIYILIILILSFVWIFLNRKQLKNRTDELKQPIIVYKYDKKSSQELVDEFPRTESEPKLWLTSTKSSEDLEKLKPQTLMSYEEMESKDKTRSAEEIVSKSASAPTPVPTPTPSPIVVIPVVAPIPSIPKPKIPPIRPPYEDEEFTLDAV